MVNKHAHFEIAQVLIILCCFVLFVQKFDFIVAIVVGLLLLAIFGASYFVSYSVGPLFDHSIIELRNPLLDILKTLLIALIFIILAFSIVFYYLNFDSGFLYSILLLLAIFGLIQGFFTSKILSISKIKELVAISVIVGFYTGIIMFGTLFNPDIIGISLTNPITFIQGIVLTVPSRLVEHIQTSLRQYGVAGISTGLLGPLTILIIISILVMSLMFTIIGRNVTTKLNYGTNIGKISKFPFSMVLVFMAISQAANGLTDFLNSTFWLLLLIQLTLVLSQLGKKRDFELLQLQVTILCWILLIWLVKGPYDAILRLQMIQNVINIAIIDPVVMMVVLFVFFNGTSFFMLYKLITSCTNSEQVLLVLWANFLGLVLLIATSHSILLKLLLITIMVLVFSFSMFQKSFLRNSINLNKVQTKKDLLQVLTQLSIFYIAFLLI